MSWLTCHLTSCIWSLHIPCWKQEMICHLDLIKNKMGSTTWCFEVSRIVFSRFPLKRLFIWYALSTSSISWCLCLWFIYKLGGAAEKEGYGRISDYRMEFSQLPFCPCLKFITVEFSIWRKIGGWYQFSCRLCFLICFNDNTPRPLLSLFPFIS